VVHPECLRQVLVLGRLLVRVRVVARVRVRVRLVVARGLRRVVRGGAAELLAARKQRQRDVLHGRIVGVGVCM
jgi:Lon protease-like protein